MSLQMPGAKVTANFTFDEFKCRDGTPVPQVYHSNLAELCRKLELLRTRLGNKGITINSGYRTTSYNAKCGGVPNSNHLYAAAADITVSGVSIGKIYQEAKACGLWALQYATFCHVDTRVNVGGASKSQENTEAAISMYESTSPIYMSTEPIVSSYNNDLSTIMITEQLQTVADVAAYVKVDAKTIKSLNDLVGERVYVGQVLFFPKTPGNTAALKAKEQVNVAANSQALNNLTQQKFEQAYFYMMAQKSEAIQANPGGTVSSTKIRNEIRAKALEYPGYDRAKISITGPSFVNTIEFLIAPESYSEQRSSIVNPQKTKAGWFVSRHGENLMNLSFSGYMLDSTTAMERHAFLEQYKDKIVDTRDAQGEYMNENIVTLHIEGREYVGAFTSLSFQKSAMRQFLFQYTFGFLGIEDTFTFGASMLPRTTGTAGAVSSASGTINSPKVSSVSSLNVTVDVVDRPPGKLAPKVEKIIAPSAPTTINKGISSVTLINPTRARIGPGTNYDYFTGPSKLWLGTVVSVYAVSGSWLRIGEQQWIHKDFTNYSAGVLNTAKVTKANAPVLRNPAESQYIIKTLSVSTTVTIYDIQNKWLKIADGQWIHQDYTDYAKSKEAASEPRKIVDRTTSILMDR